MEIDFKQMIWSGILIITGIILVLIFNSFGLVHAFLPLHIPIMLGGFILAWPYAILVALITPILSSIVVSAPHFAYLWYMLPELITYALVINIMFSKNNKAPFLKRIYLPLTIAMIVGRLSASLFQAILVANSKGLVTFFSSVLVMGIPGIILQLILIPLILYILSKSNLIESSFQKI